MTTFVTSDIHLNHLNILKYCPHRWVTNDGFAPPDWTDVSAMNELIIKNWNSVVSPEDTVWILGDVAMGQIEKAPPLISRLNGKKHLIKGNHDKTLTKKHEDGTRHSDGLFESINDVWELKYKTESGKKSVIFMSHYPHASWPYMSSGFLHLHGHLHGSPSGVTGRIMDVGMDTNNLFPYKLDDVVEKLLAIDIMRDHHV